MINQEQQLQQLKYVLEQSSIQTLDKNSDQRLFNKIEQYSYRINPADLALFVQQLPLDLKIQLLTHLKQAAYVIEYLPLNEQTEIALHLTATQLIHLIEDMHSDDRVDLVKSLPISKRHQLYQNLDDQTRVEIQSLENYAEESAGAIMSSDFVTLSAELTMQQAIEQLRQVAADRETLYLIYIVNAVNQLQGVISLRQIIQTAPERKISELMNEQVVSGKVDEDQEQIAQKLSHYDFIALPIIDDENHLLGIVTYDDAMDVLQQEFTEDALKGSAVEADSHISLKTAPILSLYKKRVFWLVLLVFGSLLSGIGISHFEEIIAAHIVLVFFLPLLVGSGGNAGSQSATLMVRAIATGDAHLKDWVYLLGRESLVALCLGGTMAMAVSILGYIRGDEMVALVLAMSMMAIVLMGCLIGMSLPFILNKLGLDPASASAPLVTSICDATGVVVYLFIASQLLIAI